MSDPKPPKPEVIIVQGPTPDVESEDDKITRQFVEQPAKVMRIGTMIKQLLEEVKSAPLDEKSRTRLREIYETSVKELSEGLSPDLREELDRLVSPFSQTEAPSDSELRIAHAQLVGWLEGIFHGIQATLFAQQVRPEPRSSKCAGRSSTRAIQTILKSPTAGPGLTCRSAGRTTILLFGPAVEGVVSE